MDYLKPEEQNFFFFLSRGRKKFQEQSECRKEVCLLVARLGISVAITRGKSPILEGLCPFLCTEVTALSLYEVIKNSNDSGEISFHGGGEGWSIKERVKRQEGTNRGKGKQGKG